MPEGSSAANSGSHHDNPHPADWQYLLNEQLLVTLEEAAHHMHGVEFDHGERKRTFDNQKVSQSLRACRAWADNPPGDDTDLHDAKRALQDKLGEQFAVEGMAAIRAWTNTHMCYVLGFVFRKTNGSHQNLDRRVLPYARLFLSALHALPVQFLWHQGPLYRALEGVMIEEWQEKKEQVEKDKMVPYNFYAPTSFSISKENVIPFKLSAQDKRDPRTLVTLKGGVGYKLQQFSEHPNEEEVLVEPVCCCTITRMETFDEDSLPGEFVSELENLHSMELRVRPGIRLCYYFVYLLMLILRLAMLTCLESSLLCLDDSPGPAKQAEEECYRKWRKLQLADLGCQEDATKEMPRHWHPFSEQEWKDRGHKKVFNEAKIMARLGRGAFMTTYRMKNSYGAVFAVKMVEDYEMEDLGITKEGVEKEAEILSMLQHKHVIRYYMPYADEGRLGLVMEWAKGGSLADFIIARAEILSMQELLDMSLQIADAIDFIHGEGIVHRDIKAENVLLVNDQGERVSLKLSDFGVSKVLTTAAAAAGSNIRSQVGTLIYHAPERARVGTYGFKADMWAVGCLLLELACCKRLDHPIWAVGSKEVANRRETYFTEMKKRNIKLGNIVKRLLDVDKSRRLSATHFKMSLRELRSQEFQQRLKHSAGDVGDASTGAGVGADNMISQAPTKKQKTTQQAVTMGEEEEEVAEIINDGFPYYRTFSPKQSSCFASVDLDCCKALNRP